MTIRIKLKERPRINVMIKRIKTTQKGGMKRERVIVDTGAKRSAITIEVARFLKLKKIGEKNIILGNGTKDNRDLVWINVTTKDGENIDLEVTVRDGLKHCILGIDWVSQSKPEFYY